MTPVIALVGNPNVGKSTLFNSLTGLRQHTGNWPGKTVSSARGSYTYGADTYTLVDLPGTYSLSPDSTEEEVTAGYLRSGEADAVLVVVDATCLARNLALALQVLEVCTPVVVCVNLLDEAAKKHITIDLHALSRQLGCPVVGTAARGRLGLDQLKKTLADTVHRGPSSPSPPLCGDCRRCSGPCRTEVLLHRAAAIAAEAVTVPPQAHRRDRLLDRLFTGRVTGMAAMLGMLVLLLWLTMAGANGPSQWLSRLLLGLQEPARQFLGALGAPWWLTGALVDGIYRTVAWVVSVMLPPMAIFFPLFTLLEDAGYLPRVAFNLDHFFQRADAHGRQSLTMCMVSTILHMKQQRYPGSSLPGSFYFSRIF